MLFFIFLNIKGKVSQIDDYFIGTISLAHNEVLSINGLQKSLFLSFQTTHFFSNVQMVYSPDQTTNAFYYFKPKPGDSYTFTNSNVNIHVDGPGKVNISIWNLPLVMCPSFSYHASNLKTASFSLFLPQYPTCLFFNFPSSSTFTGSWIADPLSTLSIISFYNNETHQWNSYQLNNTNSTQKDHPINLNQTFFVYYKTPMDIHTETILNATFSSSSLSGDWNLFSSSQPFLECDESGNCSISSEDLVQIKIDRNIPTWIKAFLSIVTCFLFFLSIYYLWKPKNNTAFPSTLFWTSDDYLNPK